MAAAQTRAMSGSAKLAGSAKTPGMAPKLRPGFVAPSTVRKVAANGLAKDLWSFFGGKNGDEPEPEPAKAIVTNRKPLVSVDDRMGSLLKKNRRWSDVKRQEDPEFFSRLQNQQTPEYLWIGCADSRVPANQILGMDPGEVFVQRNVGNQALHSDMNCMSCLEFSVNVLKVKSIIVCGHYGCGAVKAALTIPPTTTDLQMVNYWIANIRDCRNQFREELEAITDENARFDKLCELNVLRQVFHVCTSPVVQQAWARGQELTVYGVCYTLKDGLIKQIVGPLNAEGHIDHDLQAILPPKEAAKVF